MFVPKIYLPKLKWYQRIFLYKWYRSWLFRRFLKNTKFPQVKNWPNVGLANELIKFQPMTTSHPEVFQFDFVYEPDKIPKKKFCIVRLFYYIINVIKK